MKKILFASALCMFFSSSLLAGTVTLNFATDSLFGSPCQTPQNVLFIMGGSASGYTANDSVELFVAFGDGTDTTLKTPISNNNYGSNFYHTYTMPGLYTVQYVATGPDGASDTLIATNEVVLGSSCDNITGRVYVDDNGNCAYDPAQDAPIPGRSVRLKLGGQTVLQSLTDQDGQYSFNAVSGLSYDVEIENMPLNFVCPTGGSHTVSSLPASNLDFALDCSGSQHDLESMYTGGFVVPGVSRSIYFKVRNNLCTPVSGTAKLVLNSDVQYLPSSSNYYTTPDNIVGDTLFFNFSQLSISGNLNIRVRLQGDTNLTVNDSVCLEMITTPTSGDADPSNNTINPCIEVRTSYDPNMKTVSPAGEGVEGYIRPDKEMLYTIHFQNTGNFMATNIFILDTIDTQTLDLNTLKIVDYSHSMELKVLDNNILRFNFDNIMLPDSNSNEPESHGYVSFTIDQVAALSDGSEIENTAGIYFDYNPPIITNTALNTIDRSISIEEVGSRVSSDLFEAYPNPAVGSIWVELQNGYGAANLELTDLNGRKVLSLEVGQREKVNLNHLPKGVYILQLSTGHEAQQKRIIIE